MCRPGVGASLVISQGSLFFGFRAVAWLILMFTVNGVKDPLSPNVLEVVLFALRLLMHRSLDGAAARTEAR
jgi:hypothetical protein